MPETLKEMSQECPKCHGEMKCHQRVNKQGTGFDKTYRLCRCGWAQDEGASEGYWIS